MPISVNNSLPSVNTQLDLKIEEDNGMCMLVDTGGSNELGVFRLSPLGYVPMPGDVTKFL